MGSIELFSNDTNLYITIVALGIFFMACKYATSGYGVNRAIMFCFWGLLFEFLASWFGVGITSMQEGGVSINVLVFLELSLLLISLICFATCASQILLGNKPDMGIIFGLLLGGLIVNIYFVFISPDGDMVNKIRYIFPLTGFAYLSVSFWSKSSSRYGIGYLYGAIITSAISVLYLLRVLNFYIFDEWWINTLCYVILTMVVLMMKSAEILHNLSESKKEIVKYNNRIHEIIKYSPFPILLSRLSDDKIILANENAVRLFGIFEEELDRYKLKDFFADLNDRNNLAEQLSNNSVVQDFEFLAKTPNSTSPFWLLSSANIIDYNLDLVLYSAFQDITARKSQEVLLKDQATKDPLTNLYNRRYFEDVVTKRIIDNKSIGGKYAVLMIDADHFKNVNDTYGHKSGDKVLIALADISEKALRDIDVVARYGGEEFVIYLDKSDEEDAFITANRLRETISKLVVKSDNNDNITFTVSIGVATSDISDNIDTLVKFADCALYKAKENGRNRVEVYRLGDEQNCGISSKKSNIHPVFEQKPNEEISLLDETNQK